MAPHVRSLSQAGLEQGLPPFSTRDDLTPGRMPRPHYLAMVDPLDRDITQYV